MRHPSRDSRFRLGWTLAPTSLAFFMVVAGLALIGALAAFGVAR